MWNFTYASRTNLYVCLLALLLSQVWAHGASFDLFISLSHSLLPSFLEHITNWSLCGLSIQSTRLLYTRNSIFTVSQDLFASRWLPTKLVRNTSGSHSSNDKRHRADRVSVLLLLLLLLFFGYRMFKIHAAFLYIYNIYVSRSQSSRSRVPSHRTIPPPLLSFLRLFTPPERVPRTLLAHESLYTRSI